jgi:malate/lactate dehydrogenase
VQDAGSKVVELKGGKASTLSLGVAAARTTVEVVRSSLGLTNAMFVAYVDTDGTQDLPFLAIPVVLGKSGIVKRLNPVRRFSAAEKETWNAALPVVGRGIARADDWVRAKL